MTPSQCRAARALVDLNQTALSEAAGLELSLLVDFERTRRPISKEARERVQTALEAAGVEFIAENGGGVGVRMKRGQPQEGIRPEDLNTGNDD